VYKQGTREAAAAPRKMYRQKCIGKYNMTTKTGKKTR
jgi:hypothetical protein